MDDGAGSEFGGAFLSFLVKLGLDFSKVAKLGAASQQEKHRILGGVTKRSALPEIASGETLLAMTKARLSTVLSRFLDVECLWCCLPFLVFLLLIVLIQFP